MPTSPRIPKDKILSHALTMLIRDGFESITIKALAAEIGCSTQPVSWHFGHMEGLRTELAAYAKSYADAQMCPHNKNAAQAFEHVGRAYIHLAAKEPNLFKFLYLDNNYGTLGDTFDALADNGENTALAAETAAYYQISEAQAAEYIKHTIVYTHGIASFLVCGLIQADEPHALAMVKNASDAFLMQAGANNIQRKEGIYQ